MVGLWRISVMVVASVEEEGCLRRLDDSLVGVLD